MFDISLPPAFVHSKLLSEEVRGSEFKGLVHVTDWLPTLVLPT